MPFAATRGAGIEFVRRGRIEVLLCHYSKMDDQLSFFHEKCGIKKLSLSGKTELGWKKELIEWTTKI